MQRREEETYLDQVLPEAKMMTASVTPLCFCFSSTPLVLAFFISWFASVRSPLFAFPGLPCVVRSFVLCVLVLVFFFFCSLCPVFYPVLSCSESVFFLFSPLCLSSSSCFFFLLPLFLCSFSGFYKTRERG